MLVNEKCSRFVEILGPGSTLMMIEDDFHPDTRNVDLNVNVFGCTNPPWENVGRVMNK